MAGKISDVKVGLPSRKMSLHKKDVSSSFTLNFGEVTPMCCYEMDGKTKIRGNVASIVRMPPLPRPVFGELTYKQYARFVPMKEVFRNYENLRGARSLTTQFGTFTPSTVPMISLRSLSGLLLSNFCKFIIYHTPNDFSNNDPLDPSFVGTFVDKVSFLSASSAFVDNFNHFYGTQLSRDNSFDNPNLLTFENADFVLTLGSKQLGTGIGTYFYVFRLTRFGKVLYRIFNSLQFGFDIENRSSKSVLPLVAFYKAYFDLFVPANTATGNRNYTDTYAFRFSDYVCEHDVQNVTADNTAGGLFRSLLEDLSQCFYYQDPDFITSAISSPSIAPATAPGISSPINVSSSEYSSGSLPNQLPILVNGLPDSNIHGVRADAWNIKLLLRLLPYVNKDTIIGGRLRQLLKARFGYDVETLEGVSYTAGKFDLPIDISAISNSSDTTVGSTDASKQLGWQGGVGVGYNKRNDKGGLVSLHFNFKADEPGFFFVLCTIVPKAGFFQGVAPYLKHGTAGRFSIYDPAFDSLGFDLVTKDILIGRRSTNIAPFDLAGIERFPIIDFGNTPFGFVPRYFDYKTQPLNIKSGDMVRRWAEKTYSAYYLDKFISPDVLNSSLNDDGTYRITVVENTRNVPTATPDLRRIGYSDWLENFNRIFFAQGLFNRASALNDTFVSEFGVDDNFICDNLVKASYFDHSKPSSESFETDGEGVSFAIDHA